LYSDYGRKKEDVSLVQHVNNVINFGAGEIMVQSINRDGTMSGYDASLIKSVIHLSPAPIIAVGGAGNFMHLKEVFQLGVDAVGCGSLFCFGDNNPLRAKAFLKNHNIQLKNI
jgi:imidazole glycerol-phosphate synthase subunit HisF